MRWVQHIRDHCDAPPEIRSLLMVMATYADADGVCWPSLKRLAANLGIHPDSVKRRRNRAVDLGWLRIESLGRWVGTSTRYRLQAKGGVDAPLMQAQRGASVSGKGVRGRRSKGGVDAPRTTKKFQEGDNGAPSMEGRLSPIERRRTMARAIRDAKGTILETRFRATFEKEYGHLYRDSAA